MVWSGGESRSFHGHAECGGSGVGGDILTPSHELIAVSIESSETDLVVGQRTVVMEWPYSLLGNGRSYDVSLDGQQFLALKEATGGGGKAHVKSTWS